MMITIYEGLTLINLIVLAINLKLYYDYFKNRKISNRNKREDLK